LLEYGPKSHANSLRSCLFLSGLINPLTICLQELVEFRFCHTLSTVLYNPHFTVLSQNIRWRLLARIECFSRRTVTVGSAFIRKAMANHLVSSVQVEENQSPQSERQLQQETGVSASLLYYVASNNMSLQYRHGERPTRLFDALQHWANKDDQPEEASDLRERGHQRFHSLLTTS
jgi:hypothetical protein